MTTRAATAFLDIELAADKAGAAPPWVELFPAGPEIAARDGRRWTLQDPAVVVAAFERNGAPLPVDYEHAQDHRAPKGKEAPAAGWITALEIRGGAVWGRVEWTEKAAAMIAAREYRFLSPAFQHDKSGRIGALVGAGLVNRPALKMTALSRAETTPMETAMDLTALCRALGLDAGASLENILAAVERLQGERQAALAAAERPDLERFVPRADYEAVTARAEAAETALTAIRTERQSAEVDAAIEAAVKAGKIAPASRDHYRALCAQDGGLDSFQKLIGTLPVIGDPSGLDDKGKAQAGDATDPVALAARALAYQKQAADAGQQIDIAAAVAAVEEESA